MQEAIKRAISGGYKKVCCQDFGATSNHNLSDHSKEELLLDPEFWKCLGKVEEWGENTKCDRCSVPFYGWKGKMHYFIDHLAEGKDINSFFDNLLK